MLLVMLMLGTMSYPPWEWGITRISGHCVMGLYHRTVARHSLPGNKLGAVPMASVVYTNFQIHHTHTIILPPFAVNSEHPYV